jgi:hypothetical protein
MAPDPTGGLARSGLTRLLSRLGAVAVVLVGVAAAAYFLLAAAAWALLVGALLLAAVGGMVLYGARAARKTATPYWRT